MIIRRIYRDNYTVIGNDVIHDHNLSWQATGLLCYLLSLPPDWETSINHLAGAKKEGKAAVGRTMRELEEAGYVRRHFEYVKDGANIDYKGADRGRPHHICDVTDVPFCFDLAKSGQSL